MIAIKSSGKIINFLCLIFEMLSYDLTLGLCHSV